ncbi:MAG: tyrosine-type recombinase/integrase [Patescibacteria group bacterium]|nr:tyrosine-type recombinase/integrase [Patescibacteria group bacterium]
MIEDLKKWLNRYEHYLAIEKGRSNGTIKEYRRKILDFLNWLESNKHNEINSETIFNYRIHLNKRNLSLKTQSYYLIALRNFLKFLQKNKQNIYEPNLIELPKLPDREINILDDEELNKLLSAPQGNDLKSLRNRALLETLFSTGLRVSELCHLNRDINLEKGEIKVRGKGNRIRVVFLSQTAKKCLENYLKARKDNDPALFINLRGKRITSRGVQKIIKHYAKKVGLIKKVTPHLLRHQFATDLLMAGADLRAIQLLLGHKNIQTTQIYTHLTNKELKEIHRAFHGRRRAKI